jgi:hypothetical protein
MLLLHSEIVSFSSNKSELVMSWKSEEKGKSSPVTVGAGISFLHSVMLEIQKTGSGGESKKESLITGVSVETILTQTSNVSNAECDKGKRLVSRSRRTRARPISTYQLAMDQHVAWGKGHAPDGMDEYQQTRRNAKSMPSSRS